MKGGAATDPRPPSQLLTLPKDGCHTVPQKSLPDPCSTQGPQTTHRHERTHSRFSSGDCWANLSVIGTS
eukprot:2155791-Rhodomonas_salina.2